MAAQHQSLLHHDNTRHYPAYHPADQGYDPAAAFRGSRVPPRYRAVLAGAGGRYLMPQSGPAAAPSQHVDGRGAAAYAPVYAADPLQYGAGPRYAGSVAPPQHGGQHCVTSSSSSSLHRLETQVRSQLAGVDAQQLQQQQQQLRLDQSQRVDVRTQGQHVLVAARQQQSFVMSSMNDAQQSAPAASQQPQHRPAYQHHHPVYTQQYPAAPGGYRMTPGAGPLMAGSSGYVSGTRLAQQQQSVVGVPPSYPAHDASTPGAPASSVNPARVNHHHQPGRASSSSTHSVQPAAAATHQLATKVEACGGGYDLPPAAAADAYTAKAANYAAAAAAAASSQHAKLSHPGQQQRPPNVTVVPGGGPPGAMTVLPGGPMNVHRHPSTGGVKWMPMSAGGLPRHAYPAAAAAGGGGYVLDGSSARQMPPADSSSAAGWSLSMSQTQSLYMSNADGLPPPYQLAGPPPSNPDPSRMMLQRIPAGGDLGAVLQPPGHVFMDAASYAHPPAPAYSSLQQRDFSAFTDNVFVSK